MAIDPICGMEVDETTGVSAVRDGRIYYFCCEHCRAKFLTPDLVPLGVPEGGCGAGDRGGEYFCPMCEGIASDQPAACPRCGMSLERARPPARTTVYACPMHADVRQDGPGICPHCGMALEPMSGSDEEEPDPELLDMGRRFRASLLFTVPVFVLAMGPMLGLRFDAWLGRAAYGWLQLLLATPVIFWAGRPLLDRGVRSFLRRSLNMFSLIVVGVAAAYFYSAAAVLAPRAFPEAFRTGGFVDLYFESAAVIVTLVLLGQVLELRARERSSGAIRELMSLAPPTARRLDASGEVEIPLEQVRRGDRLRVRPGDKIPIDGRLVEGESNVDESMLTGESISIAKSPGDEVIGGSLNGSGTFVMTAERVGGDTVLAQIVDLVAEAQRSRAPIQRLVDAVAAWFVPAVIAAAAATFAVWAIVQPAQPALAYAVVNAVSVLIIACPCALGLATPMSILVGVGRGASVGVLVKNAEVLETLESVNVLVFDKTGTLTEGDPQVTDVISAEDWNNADLLRLAAAAEAASEHPLGEAIVRAARDRGVEIQSVASFDSIAGAGVQATIEGRQVVVGKRAMLEDAGAQGVEAVAGQAAELERRARTVVYVGVDGTIAGLLAITDPIKDSTPEVLAKLRAQGLRLVMMTGDNEATARAVAAELGIDEFFAGLTPSEKYERVVLMKEDGARVAMAGDGVNDAPALAAADVGIAMGTGAGVAIESAGVTLAGGDLRGVVRAVALSRRTMSNIRQNLVLAFGYNAAAVPIAAGVLYPFLGVLLSPMIAAAAMSASSLTVIGNALRLRTMPLD